MVNIFDMKQYVIMLALLAECFNAAAQEREVTKTDSSTIYSIHNTLTNTYFISNVVETKGHRVSYCRELYGDKQTVKKTGIAVNGRVVGVWNYFTPQGKKYMSVDFDHDQRIFFGDTTFVFEDYWKKMRHKADSIVASYYSNDFFAANIHLNSMNSGWRAKVHYKMVQGGWYDLFEAKPFEFDMAYDVVLPPNQHFDIIEFEMDSIGALNQTYRNKGLHKFTKCCFTLTEDDLWEIVKNSGVNTEASLEIKLEWSDSLSDFRIRITSFTLAPPKTGIKFRSRTIYVNPYTKACSDIEEYKEKLLD